MINNDNRFRVTWAVYRRMGSGNDTSYIRVASSVRTATRRDDQIPNSGNFWCRNQNVNDFDIEAGDIVGACIYDPSQNDRKQMDIVGQANGYSLMQMSVDNQCGDNLMPSTIPSSQLSSIDSSTGLRVRFADTDFVHKLWRIYDDPFTYPRYIKLEISASVSGRG